MPQIKRRFLFFTHVPTRKSTSASRLSAFDLDLDVKQIKQIFFCVSSVDTWPTYPLYQLSRAPHGETHARPQVQLISLWSGNDVIARFLEETTHLSSTRETRENMTWYSFFFKGEKCVVLFFAALPVDPVSL